MPTNAVLYDEVALAGFCKRWAIRELAMFGSGARDELEPNSDIDLLVSFDDGASWGLLDLATMERELSEIFSRPVDLVTRRSVEESRNFIFREHALRHVRPIYVA